MCVCVRACGCVRVFFVLRVKLIAMVNAVASVLCVPNWLVQFSFPCLYYLPSVVDHLEHYL